MRISSALPSQMRRWMRHQPTNRLLIILISLMAALMLFIAARSQAEDATYNAVIIGVIVGKTMEELVDIQEILKVAIGGDEVMYTTIAPDMMESQEYEPKDGRDEAREKRDADLLLQLGR